VIRLALFGERTPGLELSQERAVRGSDSIAKTAVGPVFGPCAGERSAKKTSTVRSHRAAELNYRRAAHAEPGMEKFFSVGAAGLD